MDSAPLVERSCTDVRLRHGDISSIPRGTEKERRNIHSTLSFRIRFPGLSLNSLDEKMLELRVTLSQQQSTISMAVLEARVERK